MAVTSAAMTFLRVGSSAGNEQEPAFQAGPLPPDRLPSEGGSRTTGVFGMAAILPQVVESGSSQPRIAATDLKEVTPYAHERTPKYLDCT
jgi:hypothetical protein